MAENGQASSPSSNSENESSEFTPMKFATLSTGSSVAGEASRGYMVPLTNTNNPNSNNNNGRLVPTPPPAQSSSDEGYHVLPRETREELTSPSSKRPKGRPLGSKSKPKPLAFTREDNDTLMKLIHIEIPTGNDIIQTLINFALSRHASVSVLSSSGLVSDVILLHPESHDPTSPIQGPFNMISLTGTYVNPNCGCVPPQFITNPSCSSFSIHLSGNHGKVFGGIVGGKVMAAGHVVISVILFKKVKFHRVTCFNENIEEVEMEDPRFASAVFIGDDCSTAEPNNNNGNNNATIVSPLGVGVPFNPVES